MRVAKRGFQIRVIITDEHEIVSNDDKLRFVIVLIRMFHNPVTM